MAMEIVLDLTFGGDALKLLVTPRPRVVPGDAATFDLVLEMTATPFQGRVEQIVLTPDLTLLATNLERLTVPGSIVFGGDRMPELVLSIERESRTGRELFVVAEATATSDAYPRLSMGLFVDHEFWPEAARTLRRLIDQAEGLS
jgi:hypothetical protein